MCMVSVVGAIGADMFLQSLPAAAVITHSGDISRAEFNALKRDVEALKLALIAAKRVDAETGQPDCEHEEKVALLRAVAKAVGVDLSEVFGTEDTVEITDYASVTNRRA